MIRVLVTGASGQVGAAVATLLSPRTQLESHTRATLDLESPAQIAQRIRAFRPQLIVNAAAYTAVDRAQSEPEAAHAANAVAPAVIGEEARHLGALVVHYSTDYVFDGTKATSYVETDDTQPLGVYGQSKREGEIALAASGCAHVILRTSWVYGPRGSNFLLTMLRVAAQRDEVRVVDDQHGAPTSALALARASAALFAPGERALSAEDLARVGAQSGLYHASAQGEVTWCGFARAIYARRLSQVPGFRAPRVVAIPTSEYPTPVRRPANSRLSNAKLQANFGVRLGSWEAGLDEVLGALA